MIKFFRRIRQKLITEGKLSKYLIYAIGEIALVMIGILLALQVNNWNSNRQRSKLERAYMLEIKDNLTSDTINIKKVMLFQEAKRESIMSTFRLFEKAANGGDYLEDFDVSVWGEHVPFEQVRIAFDNMMTSEDISLISNKILRTQISQYYSDYKLQEGDQARALELTRGLMDYFVPKFVNKDLVKSMIDVDLDLPQGSSIQLYKDQEFIGRLFTMLQVTEVLNQSLKDKKSVTKQMISNIDKELSL